MDNAQIQKLLNELNAPPLEHTPRMQIQRGEPQNYIFITANRDGLISLARLFLVAAMSRADGPTGTRPFEVPVESVVLNEETDLILSSVEHTSTIPIAPEVIAERDDLARKEGRFFLVGCWAVGIGSLFFLISGLIFWIALLTDIFK